MAPKPAGAYDPGAYPPFAVTVDVVVVTVVDESLQVLLIERGADPFGGQWALPGGFVHEDEALEAAAARELAEETGLNAMPALRQLGAFGDPGRDPRMRVVSVAYLAVVPRLPQVEAGSDARRAELTPVRSVVGARARRRLAFDHLEIVTAGVARTRALLETTPIATAFVDHPFTLSELRRVYEAVWGRALDPGNFRRKVLSIPGFVNPTGRQAAPGPEGGKPADLYRAGRAIRLDPPLHQPVARSR